MVNGTVYPTFQVPPHLFNRLQWVPVIIWKENVIHNGGELWFHVEVVAVKKYNYMADYNMYNETICNVGVNIPYVIIMTRVMVDV